MTAIRIVVTAKHIAAAGLPSADDVPVSVDRDLRDPVERAIAEVTGQDVLCDQDNEPGQPHREVATIGAGSTTLVVSLPPEQANWVERWYSREPVEPFEFDIELDDWIVALIARAATTYEQAAAVMATGGGARKVFGE